MPAKRVGVFAVLLLRHFRDRFALCKPLQKRAHLPEKRILHILQKCPDSANMLFTHRYDSRVQIGIFIGNGFIRFFQGTEMENSSRGHAFLSMVVPKRIEIHRSCILEDPCKAFSFGIPPEIPGHFQDTLERSLDVILNVMRMWRFFGKMTLQHSLHFPQFLLIGENFLMGM